MPLTRAVVSDQVFHYTDKSEFNDLVSFMHWVIHLSTTDITLQSDGSVRYYSGHSQLGDYTTIALNSWMTANNELFSDDEFHQVAGPIPTWFDEATS